MDGKLPLALYGAGQRAATEKKIAKKHGIPVCIIDADKSKQGFTVLGLPIVSLERAKETYKDFNIHVTLEQRKRAEISEYLLEAGIAKDRILNYEEFEKYPGCPYLETELHIDEQGLHQCCVFRDGKGLSSPSMGHKQKAEDTIEEWMDMREKLIGEIKEGKANICTGCDMIKKRAYPSERKIRTLGLIPTSPCQLSCIYCNAINAKRPLGEGQKQLAREFDWRRIIDCLLKRGMMAADTLVGIAGGEPTIMPRKDELLDLINDFRLNLATNGIVFDDRFAMMTARPGSMAVISVDAGTRETYRRIKGMDAFEIVCGNIKKYRERGANITMKYIFMPENSNETDMDGFISQALDAGVDNIQCSVDFNRKALLDEQTAGAIARMMDKAISHGILPSLIGDILLNADEISMVNVNRERH